MKRQDALIALNEGKRVVINVYTGGVSFVQKSDEKYFFVNDHSMFNDDCYTESISERIALDLIKGKYVN